MKSKKQPDGGESYAKLVEKGARASTDDELRAAAKYARGIDPEMHQHARAELSKRQSAVKVEASIQKQDARADAKAKGAKLKAMVERETLKALKGAPPKEVARALKAKQMPSISVQQGARGGRFYITASGRKVYIR